MASKTISNAALITFPTATGGSETEAWVGIGTASSGAGHLLYRKQLTGSLAVSNGVIPQFAIGALTVTDTTDVADYLQNNILALLFQNTANPLAGLGDTNGPQPSATAGSMYISLHTSDPGATGNQTTNEAAYTSYARVAVARSSGGWTLA